MKLEDYIEDKPVSVRERLSNKVSELSDKMEAYEDAKLGIIHAAKQYWGNHNTPGFIAGYVYAVDRLKENPQIGVKEIANDFYKTVVQK